MCGIRRQNSISQMAENSIAFVIAVNNEEVFRANVLASPIFHGDHPHEIIVRRNFPAASLAYNDGLDAARHDLIVFLHQDVYLPCDWVERLRSEIEALEACGRKWGVLGCFGMAMEGMPVGHIYSNGLNRELGGPHPPVPVQSLDEAVLILRKSSGLRFDSELPHFHFYGTDICLQAKRCGLESFAISNYCVHNSLSIRRLPPEFWKCASYLMKKWRDELPIKTCCAVLDSRGGKMWRARVMAELHYFRKRRQTASKRLADPSILLVQSFETIQK
jgi:glycosyltransferase involved in cell wall biosynthesis